MFEAFAPLLTPQQRGALYPQRWLSTAAAECANATFVTRLEFRERLLAIALSSVAGFVDAIGYGQSGGFFVSFMSGNSTRLGVGIAERLGEAILAGVLIAAFVAGVATGTIAARLRAARQAVVLGLVAASLGLAAIAGLLGLDAVALILASFAMGAENATFEEGGEVRIGLTYMTGTLVKMGQRVALALTGGPKGEWLPFLQLWLGLVAGAVLGAAAQAAWGSQAFWFAAILTGLLAAGLSSRARRSTRHAPPGA